jgi:hypothetical protein
MHFLSTNFVKKNNKLLIDSQAQQVCSLKPLYPLWQVQTSDFSTEIFYSVGDKKLEIFGKNVFSQCKLNQSFFF